MKYRKKPIAIDAYKLHAVDCAECPQWLQDLFNNSELCEIHDEFILIKTLEGNMKANVGDYIIKGIMNEFYSCESEIFEASYELVEGEE